MIHDQQIFFSSQGEVELRELFKKTSFVDKKSYLPQNSTALEIIKFYLSLLDLKEGTDFAELIQLLGIQGSLHEKIHHSKNQKQKLLLKKLNLGVELLKRPALLVLNNPFSEFNYSEQKILMKVLRRVAAKGVSVCCLFNNLSSKMLQWFDGCAFLDDAVIYH